MNKNSQGQEKQRKRYNKNKIIQKETKKGKRKRYKNPL